MNVICVDDEQLALDLITDDCKKIGEFKKIVGFEYADEALEYVKNHHVDVAFLDIDMPVMDGITLAKEMHKVQPQLNVIMTTAYDSYALEAFQNDCSGYLIKPITAEDIRHQIKTLRFAVHEEENKRIRIQCFGNFEIFVDDTPLNFSYNMSKEIMAILTDRKGALCTNSQISAILWEDGDHPEYFKSLRRDILDTIKKCGCENLVHTQRGMMGLNVKEVDCDYYDSPRDYEGEYMAQYSWAEATNSELHFKYGDL